MVSPSPVVPGSIAVASGDVPSAIEASAEDAGEDGPSAAEASGAGVGGASAPASAEGGLTAASSVGTPDDPDSRAGDPASIELLLGAALQAAMSGATKTR